MTNDDFINASGYYFKKESVVAFRQISNDVELHLALSIDPILLLNFSVDQMMVLLTN